MTDSPECTDCPLDGDRRHFLRTLGVALASLGSLGLVARDADGATIRAMTALLAAPDDRRDEKRYPIPDVDGVSIDRDNGVIIARTAGRVFAFSLACPHQNTALRWNESDRQFQCPKHKSRYREDGAYIQGRATRSMDRLALRRDGAAIVVEIDTLFQQDDHAKEWLAAFVVV
ncbi:MAG: Rieske (2Fe-2S) protein [Gemmatimonadaceae bacterium]|nr:Rieske (2Fe-2S) protein [Gemmatimonadaceae bacterium]